MACNARTTSSATTSIKVDGRRSKLMTCLPHPETDMWLSSTHGASSSSAAMMASTGSMTSMSTTSTTTHGRRCFATKQNNLLHPGTATQPSSSRIPCSFSEAMMVTTRTTSIDSTSSPISGKRSRTLLARHHRRDTAPHAQ